MTIVCVKCGVEKESSFFRKKTSSKNGYSYQCKTCLSESDILYRNKEGNKIKSTEIRKEKGAIYRKKFYENNKEKVLANNKKWAISNKDKIDEYYLSVRESKIEYNRKRYSENKEYFINYIYKRRATEIEYKLRTYLSNRLRSAIYKKNAGLRKDSIMKYIGCSMNEFVYYIENKFSIGMNWNNYGEWHIDHIIPISLFCLERDACRYVAFNYKNLQPLWGIDNILKSNKYVSPN